jgi:hypothetical protein
MGTAIILNLHHFGRSVGSAIPGVFNLVDWIQPL